MIFYYHLFSDFIYIINILILSVILMYLIFGLSCSIILPTLLRLTWNLTICKNQNLKIYICLGIFSWNKDKGTSEWRKWFSSTTSLLGRNYYSSFRAIDGYGSFSSVGHCARDAAAVSTRMLHACLFLCNIGREKSRHVTKWSNSTSLLIRKLDPIRWIMVRSMACSV